MQNPDDHPRPESPLDRQIREARERGEFDNLPGAGQPLPGLGEHYDPDWWIKDLISRENLLEAMPPTLKLRRTIELLRENVVRCADEDAVRAEVANLNGQIDLAHRGLLDGPPVTLTPLDPEEFVADWRRRTA